jgi:tRNA-dihydrouridine synthase B
LTDTRTAELTHAPGRLVIGKHHITPPVVLGPMAGYTNLPYRLICRRFGAGLVVSEMISARGLQYHNRKTRTLIATSSEEKPVAVQLFGDTPEVLYNAISEIEAAGADMIDLNMGCSVPKVRAANSGIDLMADSARAVACVSAMAEAATVPVTVKIRTGMVPGDMRYLELAPQLVDAGASALTLHARYAQQRLGGSADWTHIARLVEAVSVPVIGNGDLRTAQDATAMIEQTGCAGVMFARGALGRPWIFEQTSAALAGAPVPPDPGPHQVMQIALDHARMLAEHYDERTATHQMRGQMAHYSKGLPHALRVRRAMQAVHTLHEFELVIGAYLQSL